MSTNPSRADITDALYQVRERWINKGPPKEMWAGTGALIKMMRKNIEQDWMGDRTAKIAIDRTHAGNAGASMSAALEAATPYAGNQFALPLSEVWVGARVDWLYKKLLAKRGAWLSNVDGVNKLMTSRVNAFWKHLSSIVWGDGKGILAKGDGAFTISGTEIKFVNKACVRRFEEDDFIVLISAAEKANARPTPRNGKLKIVGRNEEAGTITVDKAVNTITGATNADYFAKWVDYADPDKAPMLGIESWTPVLHSVAATTFLGVDRSTDVGRLAGRRIPVNTSDSPYQIVDKILRRADEVGADNITVFVPSAERQRFQDEARGRGVIMESLTTPSSRRQLTMGVNAVKAMFPLMDMEVTIAVDNYLMDIEVEETKDRTYRALKMSGLGISSVEPITWVDPTGTGPWQQIVGTQDQVAVYGGFGNLYCDDPGHQLVASTSATVE